MTDPSTPPTCYRHPDRVTGLSCSRCGRPICVEDSIDAPVGQICPECAKTGGTQRVVRARQITGRPTFQTAPVSFTIIAVTAIIWILGFVAPAVGDALFRNLAMANFLVASGEWWRIFTAALLHAGITHIGFNMYALYLFGPRLEQQVGSPAFAAFYVAAAGAGGAASYAFGAPSQVSIGASGAIFGLLGAWMFVAWKMRNTPGGRRMFRELFILLAINAALPLLIPNIDWRAHAGGFLGGVLIAALWSRFAVGSRNAVAVRTAVAVTVAIASVAVVLVV